MNKLLPAGVVLALLMGLIGLTGIFFPRVTTIIREVTLGNSQNNDFPTFFNAGLFASGGIDPDSRIASTTSADGVGSTGTASSSQICTNTGVATAFPTATGTMTLPGPANFKADGRCLVNVGDTASFFIVNMNNGAGGSSTIAVGASSTIEVFGFSTSTLAASSTWKVNAIRVKFGNEELIRYIVH